MNEVDRIEELEAELEIWKNYATEAGKQLAAARREIERLKAEPKAASATPGFDLFWEAWPTNSRKVNKKGCLTRWIRAGLECRTEEIVAHVNASKASRDWTKDGGAYIPAPLVYLNQERFLAPPPAPEPKRFVGSLAGIKYNTEGIGHDGSFS